MDPKALQAAFVAGIKAVAFELFKACWGADTCNPDHVSGWKASNPAFGQADVTVLVIRDLLGGDVMETKVNGFPHYYNRLLDGSDLDLTESQFGAWASIPRGQKMDADDLIVGREATRLDTNERYTLLANSVFDAFAELKKYWDIKTDPSLLLFPTTP